MAKAKYSYLYNGRVVRNSNRLYKYGLVNENNAVIACSSTEEGALKDKIWYLNKSERGLAKYSKLEDEKSKAYADDLRKHIEKLNKWHVVELEVREN